MVTKVYDSLNFQTTSEILSGARISVVPSADVLSLYVKGFSNPQTFDIVSFQNSEGSNIWKINGNALIEVYGSQRVSGNINHTNSSTIYSGLFCAINISGCNFITPPSSNSPATSSNHLVRRGEAVLIGASGVILHSTLSGLLADDHTQYIPVNASRQPTSPLGSLAAPTIPEHYARLNELTASQSVQDAFYLGYIDSRIGALAQPIDSFLTSIASLGTTSNRIIYTTGANTAAEAILTPFGRSIISGVNAAAVNAILGLGDAAFSAVTDFALAGDITSSTLTCRDSRIIGRDDTGGGPDLITEIEIGAGLTLTGGFLSANVSDPTAFATALTTICYFREDFLTNNIGGWQQSVNGAGAAAYYNNPASSVNNPGQMRVSSGSASGGSACAYPSISCMFLNSTTIIEVIAAPQFNATTGTVIRIGLSTLTTGTSDPVNGVFFEYAKATSSNWRIRSASASSYTTTTSSTAVVFGSFIKFRITYNGTTLNFFLNGVSIGTITTNIPTVAMHPFLFVTQATASAFSALDVDLFTVYQDSLSR